MLCQPELSSLAYRAHHYAYKFCVPQYSIHPRPTALTSHTWEVVTPSVKRIQVQDLDPVKYVNGYSE